jgi:hypothetical protein
MVASLSGCLSTTVTDVDYNKHGLQYIGTVTKEPFSSAQYNLTITGELDGYPYSGTAIGPISDVVVTSEVVSLLPEVPHFTGVSNIDIRNGDQYDLLTERVVTKLDYINKTGHMHYNGTLIQERGKEPYYDMTIKTDDSGVAQMFVVNASMIGYETNVSIIAWCVHTWIRRGVCHTRNPSDSVSNWSEEGIIPLLFLLGKTTNRFIR